MRDSSAICSMELEIRKGPPAGGRCHLNMLVLNSNLKILLFPPLILIGILFQKPCQPID